MKNTEVVNYIKKSFELKNQGFYKPAIEMLYKALSIDENNLQILIQLAYIYKLLENFQRAVDYAEKVLYINPKHFEALSLLAEIYLLKNDLIMAKEISEKIYEISPTNQNLVRKINILNKLNDFTSIQKIEKSLEDFNEEVLYEIGLAYYKNQDIDKCINLLKQSYSKNHQNDKIMLLLAKSYFKKQNFQKAKEIFSDLEKTNATAEVMNYLGLLNFNEQKSMDAIKYFSAAIKLNDKNPEYLYNIACAYFMNGWLDEAGTYFNQSVCLQPDNIEYRYSLAYLYYQKKLYDKSLLELKTIKSLTSEHEPSNILQAMLIGQKGDLLAAKDQLEKILLNNESDDFAHAALAQIYKELGQFQQSELFIKKAIKLNSKSLDYLSELIEIKIQQKDYKEALTLSKELLEINKNYIYAHISIAKINLELKDFDNLFEAAQNIIELDLNCPQGYYYNAIALFAKGDKKFAIESLKKSISLEPANALLYAKISEFYQDLGDLNNAYEWIKEAGEIDERNYTYKWLTAKLASVLNNKDEAIKYYSQSYRLASWDKELSKDYANYLTSIGKETQAQKLLK
jgi:tetratricopeptide (TPR) repeat protein